MEVEHPINGNPVAARLMALVRLEKQLPEMSDADVVCGYNQCAVESEEADLHAGEMERRNLDD